MNFHYTVVLTSAHFMWVRDATFMSLTVSCEMLEVLTHEYSHV